MKETYDDNMINTIIEYVQPKTWAERTITEQLHRIKMLEIFKTLFY